MSRTDEIGASRLASSPPSLAQKLEDARTQAEILNVMRGVIQHRDNVHCVSTSILPDRPTPPTPQPKGTGWADRVPLSNPDGVAQCDRLVEAFEALEKQERTKP